MATVVFRMDNVSMILKCSAPVLHAPPECPMRRAAYPVGVTTHEACDANRKGCQMSSLQMTLAVVMNSLGIARASAITVRDTSCQYTYRIESVCEARMDCVCGHEARVDSAIRSTLNLVPFGVKELHILFQDHRMFQELASIPVSKLLRDREEEEMVPRKRHKRD